MKNKKLFLSTIVCGIASIIFTILLIFVDKKAIGPLDSKVGFATINDTFRNLIGENNTFKTITKFTGILLILVALAYLVIALIQAIKRKSIKKIDKELIYFGVFLVGLVAIYILFELFKINCRPILEDGKLEASYPSSHTMLAVFICISSIFINSKLVSNKYLKYTLNTIIICISSITLIGRIISGVHWITDIIGGTLISTTLALGYLSLTLDEEDKDGSID